MDHVVLPPQWRPPAGDPPATSWVYPSGGQTRSVSRYELEQRLHRAASPVLAAVSQDLRDPQFALSLADSGGRVIRQWVHSPATATVLSQAAIVSEAIRAAVRTREACVVRGREPLVDSHTACATGPVNDPVSGHMLGVVALTCLGATYSSTMPALVARLVHEIRQQLRQGTTESPATPDLRPAEPASPAPSNPALTWTSLTDSERRVAVLVVQGLTNREVAAKLTVSPHTVDYYLRRIYQKLGLRSRVQLTRLATTGRAAEPENPALSTVCEP
jgi:DNA-binding CsgD family transcriptional regulator